MKLTIKSVDASDFGSYKCVAKNSLGDTDGAIKLYRKHKYIIFFLFFFMLSYVVVVFVVVWITKTKAAKAKSEKMLI